MKKDNYIIPGSFAIQLDTRNQIMDMSAGGEFEAPRPPVTDVPDYLGQPSIL